MLCENSVAGLLSICIHVCVNEGLLNEFFQS